MSWWSAPPTTDVLTEARRVARHVVVTLEAAEHPTGSGTAELGPHFTVDVERIDTEARETTSFKLDHHPHL